MCTTYRKEITRLTPPDPRLPECLSVWQCPAMQHAAMFFHMQPILHPYTRQKVYFSAVHIETHITFGVVDYL